MTNPLDKRTRAALQSCLAYHEEMMRGVLRSLTQQTWSAPDERRAALRYLKQHEHWCLALKRILS